MILVTGGFGFIGSNLIKALNHNGVNDIIVCDSLKNNSIKFKNLIDCSFTDYIHKDDINKLNASNFSAVYHLGACANTLELDAEYMMKSNYFFSKDLFHLFRGKCPFIYASSAAVYGSSTNFDEHNNHAPLNIYGYSKLLFDKYVTPYMSNSCVTGLRFFNVYGPNEDHKGKMASVIHQLAYKKLTNLFFDGNQSRDFIHVYDVVSVLLHFYDNPRSGIFNVGTGKAATFNQIKDCLGLDLEYVPIPDHIKPNYQEMTQAKLDNLINIAGYTKSFMSINEGIKHL